MLIKTSNLRENRRRGIALYITVLGVAALVAVGALSALATVRTNARIASLQSSSAEAELLAFSAIEHALTIMNMDGSWRTSYTHGAVGAQFPLNRGTASWMLLDASLPTSDGNLADDPTEQVRIYGIGRVGESVRVRSVLAEPVVTPLKVLRTVAHSAGDFNATKALHTNGGPLSSNTVFNNGAGELIGDVEAPTYVGTGGLTGTYTETPPKVMPLSSVFDSIYLPMATEIDFYSLPTQGVNYVISGMLGPSSNPSGGPTNPKGIYHINVPTTERMKITSFDMTGTLLMTLGAGASVFSVNPGTWQPNQPDYPVLIVKADNSTSVSLSGTNGKTCQGLVHIIGTGCSTTLGSRFNLIGTVIAEGTILAGHQQATTLTADPNLYANPPLGYVSYGMAPVPQSWRWDELP